MSLASSDIHVTQILAHYNQVNNSIPDEMSITCADPEDGHGGRSPPPPPGELTS